MALCRIVCFCMKGYELEGAIHGTTSFLTGIHENENSYILACPAATSSVGKVLLVVTKREEATAVATEAIESPLAVLGGVVSLLILGRKSFTAVLAGVLQ